MIKLKLKDGAIVLGIDAENVKRLKAKQPILIKGAELKIENDIYIVFGETLDEIVQDYGIPRPN